MPTVSYIAEAKIQFSEEPARNIDSLGYPYDLCSMMHYSQYAFGAGRTTIKVKDQSKQHWIGQRDGFSEIDILQINAMYKCGMYHE